MLARKVSMQIQSVDAIYQPTPRDQPAPPTLLFGTPWTAVELPHCSSTPLCTQSCCTIALLSYCRTMQPFTLCCYCTMALHPTIGVRTVVSLPNTSMVVILVGMLNVPESAFWHSIGCLLPDQTSCVCQLASWAHLVTFYYA